jgi:lipopolysaccharide biosynthesis glycosyltransferase
MPYTHYSSDFGTLQASEPVAVFYSSDETYAPYLAVSIQSLIENANSSRRYRIVVMERGMSQNSQHMLKGLANTHVSVEIVHINDKLNDLVNTDDNLLRDDYKTTTLYFRLFIAELFPDLDRAVYLDADTVVPSDIADLYDTDLKSNLIGACHDVFMDSSQALTDYVQNTQGYPVGTYINSGVLLMDLAGLRSVKFMDRFLKVLNAYHVPLAAVDQDYINFMLHDRRLMLDQRWNTMMTNGKSGITNPGVIHYNLFNKPWHYPEADNANYFWKYAPDTPRYQQLLDGLRDFNPFLMSSDAHKKAKLIAYAQSLADGDQLTLLKLMEKGVDIRI